jgi:hypothetical protein
MTKFNDLISIKSITEMLLESSLESTVDLDNLRAWITTHTSHRNYLLILQGLVQLYLRTVKGPIREISEEPVVVQQHEPQGLLAQVRSRNEPKPEAMFNRPVSASLKRRVKQTIPVHSNDPNVLCLSRIDQDFGSLILQILSAQGIHCALIDI